METADAATLTGTVGDRVRPEGSSVLDDAGQALFRLGRIFSKQPMSQVLMGRTGRAVELSRVLVVQAVEAGPEEPGREVTVGMVADRLGIDPSTASRVVAETIAAGYLSRVASAADGRRVHLALTDAGRTLSAQARRYQRGVFEHVTRDWSDQERHAFAGLLTRFVDAVTDTRAMLTTPDTHP